MKGFDTRLFLHIPKTAGTSFRLAVERAFGSERVAYDYSPKAWETSDAVREHYYTKKDLEALRAKLMSKRVVLLAGHFDFRRYSSILPPSRVVTFLRDPVARVVAEYHHFRRHNGFEGALLEFASQARNRNLQCSILRGVPLEDAEFVGITEHYEESLARLRERLGWDLEPIVTNVNPERTEIVAGDYPLSKDEASALREWNKNDLELFDAAVRMFRKSA